MGFYLRKSVRVGPFRINLSKSGLGLSAGVKGLRLGTGPRGNYVHMGAGGLYYRTTLPGSRAAPASQLASPLAPPAAVLDGLTEIDSNPAAQMVDSSSEELLRELDTKRRKVRVWPWLAAGAVLPAVQMMRLPWPDWALWAYLGVAVVATYAVARWDRRRKTTRLFYEIDAERHQLVQRLHAALTELGACAAIWHVQAEGANQDAKRNAGANVTTRKVRIHLADKVPPYVETNVPVPRISAGRQTLYFFPDRMLIFDTAGVGAVGYSKLRISYESVRFIEGGTPPSDSQVVGRTWQYVNKSGGPDRRFRENRELPVCLYEEVTFRSDTGLNEKIQLSRVGRAAALAQTVSALGALA